MDLEERSGCTNLPSFTNEGPPPDVETREFPRGCMSPSSPYRIDMASSDCRRLGAAVAVPATEPHGPPALPCSSRNNTSLEGSQSKVTVVESLSTQGSSMPSSPQGDRAAQNAGSNTPPSSLNRPKIADAFKRMKYYRYDSLVKLEKPFARPIRRLLEITELPFMIMWVYFTYWVIIVSLCATQVRNTVWISAAIAGLLVGIGLNANAYRMIIEHGTIDYGVVIRFFIIPFGVSSLSGMTNSLRDQFLLVFPRDLFELTISICIPAMLISCLVIVRVTLLWRLRVRMTFRVLLLNGSLTDRCRTKENKGFQFSDVHT